MRHTWFAVRFIVLTSVIAFVSLAAGAAGTSADRKSATRPAPPRAWEAGVVTSGGFTGSGKGTISLRSDGAFTPRFPCKLDEERLADVGRAVAAARPENWPRLARGGSLIKDQYSYSLFLRLRSDDRHEESFTISWRDESYFALPPDLRNLYEALWAARAQLNGDCRWGLKGRAAAVRSHRP